ncbi:MAG: hypothetical protein ABW007_26190 [Chitinophagaceae bacterium]
MRQSAASLRSSLISYLVLLVFLAISVLESLRWEGGNNSIRLVGWNMLVIWLFALGALFLQRAAGFPDWLDPGISNRSRFMLPLCIGFLFGVADVVVFELILQHPPYKELPPFLQPFPHSIFLYFCGAIYVDVLFKLLPMTIIMTITRRMGTSKIAEIVFWVSASMLALYEPLEQMPDGSVALVIYSTVSGFAFNLLAIYFLRKSGWFAALMVRCGHYLVWHVLLGIYVEFLVIG